MKDKLERPEKYKLEPNPSAYRYGRNTQYSMFLANEKCDQWQAYHEQERAELESKVEQLEKEKYKLQRALEIESQEPEERSQESAHYIWLDDKYQEFEDKFKQLEEKSKGYELIMLNKAVKIDELEKKIKLLEEEKKAQDIIIKKQDTDLKLLEEEKANIEIVNGGFVDLTFIATEDLIEELHIRCDCMILGMHKKSTIKEEDIDFWWFGGKCNCIGMTVALKKKILDELKKFEL